MISLTERLKSLDYMSKSLLVSGEWKEQDLEEFMKTFVTSMGNV